ncbi:MAG TPA: DoxX family protein [Candidatus Elarobacter sp.]|jgi:putative oxidoreductase|nr:DoxX family protein [Candidatus Elarobacter sp.]
MIDDLGLLASRLAVGLGYAAHGAQKALGWFEGPGLDGAGGFMESLGFKPGKQYATVASDGEMAAGLMIALGLGGPIGPAILLSGMIVAQNTVHRKNGFFAANNGVEVGVLYASAALAFASTGYGRLSLDHMLGLREKLRHPAFTTLVLGGAIATGYLVLNGRDTGPPAGTLATPTIKGAERDGGQNGQRSEQPSPATT